MGRNVGSTALVTDSTCYLSAHELTALGVDVVPLTVTVGDRTFAEGEIEPAEFYRLLRAAGRPAKTSQPAPGEFARVFQAAAGRGAHRVLAVVTGAALSGTHRSATLAARLVAVPVDVVDSGTISGGLVLVVGETARALAEGADHHTARGLAQALSSRVASTFVTDSLPLLRAGGRLPAAAVEDPAEGEGAVSTRSTGRGSPPGVPVLALRGTLHTLGTATTVEDAVAMQARVIRASALAAPSRVSVGHGDVPELADALAASLAGAPGVTEVVRYVVGPAVGAHAGPGNFGASYFRAPG